MTYVTEILANEPGIQYQGVKDKTGGTGVNPIAGLITGQFRRGRLDKPMTITNANIRAMLGHDPKNPSYTAVQDALNSGVPSVQVLRLKDSSSLAVVEIDASVLSFPPENSFVAFTIPSSTHRFSINVDGENLTGTLADVMARLAEDYGILTTYITETQVIFTAAWNDVVSHIAITGVTPAPKDDTNYLLSGITNQWSQDQYCDVFAQPNNIYTFSLKSKREGSWIPALGELDLYSTLNIKVSFTAKSIDTGDYKLTSIPLSNWVNGSYESFNINTQCQFFNPDEIHPFSYVIANRQSDNRFLHLYKAIGFNTFIKSINDLVNGKNTILNEGPLNFSSVTFTMRSSPSVYFDFSQEPKFQPFLKGYVPYLEVGL